MSWPTQAHSLTPGSAKKSGAGPGDPAAPACESGRGPELGKRSAKGFGCVLRTRGCHSSGPTGDPKNIRLTPGGHAACIRYGVARRKTCLVGIGPLVGERVPKRQLRVAQGEPDSFGWSRVQFTRASSSQLGLGVGGQVLGLGRCRRWRLVVFFYCVNCLSFFSASRDSFSPSESSI